ncbi:hypothetical protein AGABI2DRAFT_199301 [Agaricus bisporus var. bisporus H97]|uniref:hypothetical protein n=1 Tax=Agaricus bisporus var. bisporus (strain H97 / ATCC MYA-4626 / FGSC 10389) TaxID=936046 RepID=UPI00029F6E2B|nr:hypothetical protein AGABI2DRAFT_199301 [Agaricus bisporus var. bisporus H97]EKV50028.1 hypothetical protein AGABI2DRAFT_199301 [Agaricus bisporus var. bisporus H97]
MPSQNSPPAFAYVGEDDSAYFRVLHGRKLNVLNTVYLLPVDEDEVKRSDRYHRLLQFVFHGHNYIGPVKEVLQFGRQRRILDLGTGGGSWAIAMADEFPRAEVVGVDLAPIQPRYPSLVFELCDLDQYPIPYPDGYFDLIHARSMHTGIRDYPSFLREIARLLRPGGLVHLIEPDLHPVPPNSNVSSPVVTSSADRGSIAREQRGWIELWETYRSCLRLQGIDVSVPEHLSDLLSDTGQFEKIVVQDGNIPVGFWPKDENLLTVGQLQWMDYELFLPALKPLFLSRGIPPSQVDRIINLAQHDLYYPTTCQSTRLHIVHAFKRWC